MVSTTRVTTAAFPAALHLNSTIFCVRNTFSAGMSSPKLPRLKITPSLAATIASMVRSAPSRSTLATTPTPSPPACARHARHSATASAEWQ